MKMSKYRAVVTLGQKKYNDVRNYYYQWTTYLEVYNSNDMMYGNIHWIKTYYLTQIWVNTKALAVELHLHWDIDKEMWSYHIIMNTMCCTAKNYHDTQSLIAAYLKVTDGCRIITAVWYTQL